MKKPLIVLIVVIALAAGGYFAWRSWGPGASTVSEALAGSGSIEADQVAITPLIAGRVVSAPSQEGTQVRKGDVLFKLDASLLSLQVDQAKAGVDAARTNYTSVRDDDGSTKAQIASAKAQYQQAQAALKMAQVQLGYAAVSSPIDGVLSSVAVHEGETAIAGNTLATVSDTAHLTVTIYVPENRIGEVRLGQSGTITTDSTTRDYAGKVVFVATDAEFTPSSVETKDQRVKLVYQVKLAISDADAALKPGMPADVTLR